MQRFSQAAALTARLMANADGIAAVDGAAAAAVRRDARLLLREIQARSVEVCRSPRAAGEPANVTWSDPLDVRALWVLSQLDALTHGTHPCIAACRVLCITACSELMGRRKY